MSPAKKGFLRTVWQIWHRTRQTACGNIVWLRKLLKKVRDFFLHRIGQIFDVL